MRLFKTFFRLGGLILAGQVHAASCPLPDMTNIAMISPTCDFYQGTAAYRAKQYAQAASYWQKVIAVQKPSAAEVTLQSYTYNNLGYLSFYGFGIAVDQPRALRYWRIAMKSGDAEPVYHLCHAYAEPSQPSFNRAQALTYCPEALRRYQAIRDKSPGDLEIIADIQGYQKALRSGKREL